MADKLPCFFTDKALEEWESLPSGLCKDAVGKALGDGFPWYSIGYGPINQVGDFIEWDIPHPDVANLPIDGGDDDPPPPDITPLGYRIYGSIEVERASEPFEKAAAYFLVRGIREIIRLFRFEPPASPPTSLR